MLCPEQWDHSGLWGREGCWAPSEVLHPDARTTTGAELRCREPIPAPLMAPCGLDTRHRGAIGRHQPLRHVAGAAQPGRGNSPVP